MPPFSSSRMLDARHEYSSSGSAATPSEGEAPGLLPSVASLSGSENSDTFMVRLKSVKVAMIGSVDR